MREVQQHRQWQAAAFNSRVNINTHLLGEAWRAADKRGKRQVWQPTAADGRGGHGMGLRLHQHSQQGERLHCCRLQPAAANVQGGMASVSASTARGGRACTALAS